jgi:hypothetical protein
VETGILKFCDMKERYLLLVFIFGVINFYCKKETSCEGCKENNKPPTAIAGSDQVITLPTDSVLLDGRNSSDPDGTISVWLWTKISGPASFNVNKPNDSITLVKNLTTGVYQFELKITDNGGLFSKDTVQVFISSQPPPPSACDNSNRPLVSGQLIPFATLPGASIEIAVSSGNKILFAGGTGCENYNAAECKLRVDIYDTITHTWSINILDGGRFNIAVVAAGNRVFFAGGRLGDGANDILYSTVNIYEVSTNTWTVASLSEPRCYIAAATVGNKVVFAGGEKDWNYNTSNKVDIYDVSTNAWSTALLSENRSFISAVTTNNKIYFAGGHIEDRWYQNPSNRIDIYDNNTNSWSVSSLAVHTGIVSSISVNNNIYWAAGCPVEIRNVNTGSSSISNLFRPGGSHSVIKDDKIVFIEGGDKFDIYDITTNTWSVGILPVDIYASSIISVNNTIYVAGGNVNGSLSGQVWELEF